LPKAANKPMEAALEMAEGLLKMYKDEKQGIQYKYRECDYYKEGADYKVQLSQSIGGIKAMKLLINQIKEQLK
jgi:NifU-like protein involved in Fe-S cluster formation